MERQVAQPGSRGCLDAAFDRTAHSDVEPAGTWPARPLGRDVWELDARELGWALELPPAPRYAYALNKIKEHGELWVLNTADGWILSQGETRDEGLPVWPHPEFAREFATGRWREGFPEAIALDHWLDTSTGVVRDAGWHVAVFFTFGTDRRRYTSIQVSADKFASDLRAPRADRYVVPEPIE